VWTHLSADGNSLTVSVSRPWLQGIFGLAFAGAAATFVVLFARGDVEMVQNGVRVPVPALVCCGSLIIAGAFVLLGLVVAGHRKGVTLDRQASEAIDWEGLLVPLSSTRHSLRGYTTVWLQSAIREGLRDKNNRSQFYRAYYVKLLDPKGRELLLGQSGAEKATRAAAQKIAEFLGLEFADRTTGDAPLPANRRWHVSLDVPGLGPVSVESAAPPAPELTAYEFRDRAEQPEGSRVQVEPYAEGVTLTVPPAGIWRGSKGLLVFGLIWTVLISAIGLIVMGFMQQSGHYHKGVLAGLAFFELVGLFMVAGAIQMGRRRAVLAVVGERLLLLQAGPFRRTRREWARDELTDVRTGHGSLSAGGEPVIELQVIARRGKKCGLLGGRDEEELRWLATVLRRSLALSPATPSR
jgi:hypothetical protein